jgi:hypothetical protein
LVRIRIRQYHCEEDESRQNRVKTAEFRLHLGKDYFKELTANLMNQFSILAKLKRLGPLTINTLARDMVMDRK